MALIIIQNDKGTKLDDYNSDIIPIVGDTFVEKWGESDRFTSYVVVTRLISATSNTVGITVKEK